MENFLNQLLAEYQIAPNKTVDNTLLKLIDNSRIAALSKSITAIKQEIIDIFNMYKNKEDFKESYISITNANAKKEYEYLFDMQQFPDIDIKEIRNLEKVGLQFDTSNYRIFGTPSIANTIDLQIVFYSKTDQHKTEDIKIVSFIINADPKDLWKDIPSDKNLKYAKEDNDSILSDFLDKRIVIASRRGRSHAHEGSFREDHFCTKQLQDNWAMVAVADGAGSAKYSRKGSQIATEFIIDHFSEGNTLSDLDTLIKRFYEAPIQIENSSYAATKEEQQLQIKSAIINVLYKSVRRTHTFLAEFAQQENINVKELNTTLIFALVKKLSNSYMVLTFGVGDCPINIITKNFDKVQLLNIMDVGEFGGGTRFITMPEIFNNATMGSRFTINKFEDFSKLVLMTDGIYDPKFVTENKLEDIVSWKNFIADLEGSNEDEIKVNFENDENIQAQLLMWMDFWSKGNHDDRTLAIIY
ncbi:PP2C family serine/threonine-protein phosphatase [Niabella sp. 22666]|uniref:PP2C family serine/threonine-protein phosphatase n=1 Tax=Niabella sp. 22666 TaxID=3453954 RepID=UPI003F83E99B